tara:strand:+ start:207 stop:512 length:306 start_codon:yes stop_codon:yes gene_type:complete
MSFPTPHESFLKSFQELFNLFERDFLEPRKLKEHINNIENLIKRDYLTITSEDGILSLSPEQKQVISDTIKKIDAKQQASIGKVNWSNNFSGFLQEQLVTK